MSIRCISEVLDGGYGRGGSHLLLLVILAEFADDTGGSIYPSIARLAKRMRCEPRQVQKLMRDLESDGVLIPVGNAGGGRPGSTRRWRLDLKAIKTPVVADTPVVEDRGGLSCRTGQGCSSGHPNRHLTAIDPMTGPAAPDANASPGNDLLGAANPREAIWSLGKSLLMKAGSSESAARSFLGRFAKQDEQKLAETIGYLAANPKVEPRAYIAAAMKPKQREFVG